MSHCRILIAEDDSAAREMVAAFLRLKGHTVADAADGATAMILARQFNPDVVLTDICMPQLDGVELCRRLHADPHMERVPVLAMTALPLDAGADLAGAGFEGVLFKPLELDDLERHVAAACAAAGILH